jgi:copper ion binding protein
MAQTIEFSVTGMSCDHCVNSVTNALKGLEGVSEVKVSLADKSAVVSGSMIDTAKVIAAIEEEGYEAAIR